MNPLPKKPLVNRPEFWIIAGMLVGLPIIAFIASVTIGAFSSPPAQTVSSGVPVSPEGREPNPIAPTEPEPGSQWVYTQMDDAMGKGKIFTASVRSTNTVSFEFPYAGPQYGTLTIRTHARHGKDVILRIERGQFLCNSYDGCRVLVRFDDGEAQYYEAGGPSDNSTEILFIHNYSGFVSRMLKANRVRISAEIHQEGSPLFEFDVRGFDKSRYKPTS